MKYTVDYTDDAKKQLKKMDPYIAKTIVKWIRKKLVNCENPRTFGKPLKHNLKDIWRYRYEDYRILAKIEDNHLIILIVTIDHRKQVYNR